MTHHKKPSLTKRLQELKVMSKEWLMRIRADKVQQISAVRAAVDGVVELMVQDFVEHYLSQTRGERGSDRPKGYNI